MRAFGKEPRRSRDATAVEDGVQARSALQAGSGSAGSARSKPPLGSSVRQMAASQRTRLPSRKPPEPLRRAVAACLSATHHASSETVRILQDYLASPSTVDLAYTVLLDHAIAERDRSPPVIVKCVALLKRYLVRYIPKVPMLQQVDAFCASLITECHSVANNIRAPPFVQLASEPANSRSVGSISVAPSVQASTGLTTTAFASDTLLKSLNYVRALVACHLPNNPFQSAIISGISKAQSNRNRTFNAQFGTGGILKRGISDDKEVAKAAAMYFPGLEEIDEEDNRYIALDVLRWRWIGGKRQQCWAPSPVMTDSGGIARPHVECIYRFGDMGAASLTVKANESKLKGHHGRATEKKTSSEFFSEKLLQPSTVTTITDNAAARSHLRAVAALKRQKSQSYHIWDFDVPMNSWRRRLRPLFQYKHYSEQQPLRLSDGELEEVISAVCMDGTALGNTHISLATSLPGRLAIEAADVAGSVLIKLLIDMYMADPCTAAPLTVSMLEGMLGSSVVAVRIRAFDLILNLGVHAHLLEPMQMEEQTALEEESLDTFVSLTNGIPLSSSARCVNLAEAFRAEEMDELIQASEKKKSVKSLERVDCGTSQAVESFELWLLDILFEMLLFLVQMEEAEEGVWTSALSCILYLVSDRGRIQRQRLFGLDIRVLRVLLDVSWENAWEEELHCQLVRMLSNLLYKMPSTTNYSFNKITFDLEQLELIGGIEFICIEYSRVKAVEAKCNLFTIVLEYILHELHTKFVSTGRHFPGPDEIQAVVTSLCLGGAPESVALALKLGLRKVGEGLAKSIIAAMARDVSSGRLNAMLLEEITSAIDLLVATYSYPDEEFSGLLSTTMVSEGLASMEEEPSDNVDDSNNVSRAWATLHALLHSPRASFRFNGYSWLLELLFAEMTRGSMQEGSKPNISILQDQLALVRKFERADGEGCDDTNSAMICSAVQLLCGLLKSKHPSIRRGFIVVLERLLLTCQLTAIDIEAASHAICERGLRREGMKGIGLQEWADAILGLMNEALYLFVSANDTDRINILQMCEVMFSQLCIRFPSSSMASLSSNAYTQDNMVFDKLGSNSGPSGRLMPFLLDTASSGQKGDNFTGIRSLFLSHIWKQSNKSSSMAAMLLRGQAATPQILVANMPTALLYWPLLQLAGAATEDMALVVAVGSRGRGNTPGGASDVRAALLVLLIGKCTAQHAAFAEVGGEEFFRSLLDDADARVAYYTSAFLLKRMMTEEPEKYQRMLHGLVFKAQQSNNEKLLENPYLQTRGILQLSNDFGSALSFQEV